MSMGERWAQLCGALRAELRHLTYLNPSKRSWEMPLAAVIALGAPLIVGASLGRMDFAVVGMLGGLVFLSLSDTRLRHRMVLMMALAFAMIACYAMGALTHLFPAALIVVLTTLTCVASMTARFYRLPPPGILFIIMAASIAAYTPAEPLDIPLRIGLVAMGAVFACSVAFVYSLYHVRGSPPGMEPPVPGMDFDYVVVDSTIIAACVGFSLLLAELLQLERPYWVPVSCLAVIQGANLRMVWNRHAQRVLGTVVGMGLAWLLLELRLEVWGVVAMMIALSFIIELIIVRHYGLAVVFITPLTIFLAESTQLAQHSATDILLARVVDIAIGSSVGLAGGAVLHVPAVRARVARGIRFVLRC